MCGTTANLARAAGVHATGFPWAPKPSNQRLGGKRIRTGTVVPDTGSDRRHTQHQRSRRPCRPDRAGTPAASRRHRRGDRHHGSPEKECPVSDNEVAPLETAFGVDHHVTRAEAPERPVQDGGPEMVQLLSPEGERVPHPEHDAVVDAPDRRGAARLLPRPRPHPALRRRGHRAPAPGRARPVGQPPRPGGRPGRLRPRAAPAGLRLPHLPRARRRLVPRRRPGQPARHVPRRQPRRLGPEREELPPLHDHHRRADPARHRLRHGRPARRQRRHRRRRPRHRRHRLLRRRRDEPGRRLRGARLRRRQQQPRSSSSARTTSGPSPSPTRSRPAPRSGTAPAASASPASGSTATTCSPCTP